MEKIVVSAPGKVILHGEHAVVYGKRALASSLNIRTQLTLTPTQDGKVLLKLPDIEVEKSWDVSHIEDAIKLPICARDDPHPPSDDVLAELQKLAGVSSAETETRNLALVAFLHLFWSITPKNGKLPSVEILVESEMPPSAGLGSSAAYATCLSSSLLLLSDAVPKPTSTAKSSSQGLVWTEESHLKLINSWAFEAEKVIHGKPSGIDNSISTYGGAISYQNGQITPLKKVPTLRIMLTNTREPRSTKVLVSGVRQKYDKHTSVIEPILHSIEAISTQCEKLLSQVDGEISSDQYKTLGGLVEINQCLLGGLGVSHPRLEQIIVVAKRHKLSSKLTGAGGGGCAFTLLPPECSAEKIKNVKLELFNLGFDSWETSVAGPGVLYHETPK